VENEQPQGIPRTEWQPRLPQRPQRPGRRRRARQLAIAPHCVPSGRASRSTDGDAACGLQLCGLSSILRHPYANHIILQSGGHNGRPLHACTTSTHTILTRCATRTRFFSPLRPWPRAVLPAWRAGPRGRGGDVVERTPQKEPRPSAGVEAPLAASGVPSTHVVCERRYGMCCRVRRGRCRARVPTRQVYNR
jgi:hypothetical protein